MFACPAPRDISAVGVDELDQRREERGQALTEHLGTSGRVHRSGNKQDSETSDPRYQQCISVRPLPNTESDPCPRPQIPFNKVVLSASELAKSIGQKSNKSEYTSSINGMLES